MCIQTLPSSLRRSRAQKDSEKTGRSGVGELLRYPPFQNVLLLYGSESIFASANYLLILVVVNSIMYTWEAIYPLFAFSSTSLGGLQLSVRLQSYQIYGLAHQYRPSDPDDRCCPRPVCCFVNLPDRLSISCPSSRHSRKLVPSTVYVKVFDVRVWDLRL